MSKIEDIEKAVENLPAVELEKFRAWFADFDSKRFDDRIASDATSGALDRLADKALTDHRNGRTQEL